MTLRVGPDSIAFFGGPPKRDDRRELVIKSWLFGLPDVAPGGCRYPRAGGWASVEEMQRDRLAHYRDHPYERAEAIPNGIRIYFRSNGQVHQEVTIEGVSP